MEEHLLLGAGAIFLVTLATSMARLGSGAGGMAWAIAWTCLYGSGFFSLVASD